MVLVAVQVSVLGLYLPPVLKLHVPFVLRPTRSFHCQSRRPCEPADHGGINDARSRPRIICA